MNAEKFMTAIGSIGDKYIDECAHYSRKDRRKKVKAIIFSAACACIAGILAFFAFHIFLTNQKQIVWNENPNIYEAEAYFDQAVKGKILLTESLQSAALRVTPSHTGDLSQANDKYIFAVLVTETTGASKEEIYENFIIPLGVKEEYLKSGIIFVTRQQLYSMECPDDFAVILSLAAKQ